jgi:YHS domain-containing protein
MTIGPVCAMAVEQADNPWVEVDGQILRLCSIRCRDEFATHPERFLLLPKVAS